jgi:hypothetical protein
MNESIRTADRATHVKVGMLALLSCIAFVAVATSGRVTSHHQGAMEKTTQSSGIGNHATQIGRGDQLASLINALD